MLEQIKFVPANMPGCQMMSNLKFTPAVLDGICKINHLNYIPAPGSPEAGRFHLKYVLASIGIDRPFINSKVSNHIQNGYKLSWWEPNSFFQYDSMLISAYYGMKWKDNFREFFNIPNDFIIIGDSGGFQNMTQNANLNPIEVLRWQEKHCQIGLTFDLPIFKDDSYKIKQQKQIQTTKNAQVALEKRENKGLKLYAVFQGHNIEEQEYMLECYQKYTDGIEKFDGIAIGGLVPISGNTEMLIKVLTLFCYNTSKYNKPIHFFGLSGNKIIPYIIYLQRLFNLDITFDSSSYGAGAIRREFWIGNGKKKINCMKENYDKIPCDCPVCSIVKDFNEYKKDGSIAGGLISLHNLYQTLQHIEKMKKTELKLNNKYKRFIDIMKDKGPEYAFDILNTIKKQDKETQKTIFDST